MAASPAFYCLFGLSGWFNIFLGDYMYVYVYIYYMYIYVCKYMYMCISQLHAKKKSAAQAGPLSLKTRVEYSSMPKNAMQAVIGSRGSGKAQRAL